MATLFVSLNKVIFTRLYSVWDSVEVCPYINSHYEYCSLSSMELLMTSPYGMVVSLGVRQILQLMSSHSLCMGTYKWLRDWLVSHTGAENTSALGDGTTWFCDPPQTLQSNPCLRVCIHICVCVGVGGHNSWQDTHWCLCSAALTLLLLTLVLSLSSFILSFDKYRGTQKWIRSLSLPSLKPVG